jgi:hypothetical protein
MFDWEQYLINYPDLRSAGICTQADAIRHYKRYGMSEGRTDQKIIENIKITIITPCSRPENLKKLFESINFEFVSEWIICYDFNVLNPSSLSPRFDHPQISEYYVANDHSVSGNYQRNYGLSKIKNENVYLYFLDDDNIIHPDLYKIPLKACNFYSFNQLRNDKIFEGNVPKPQKIDSAMVLIYYPLVKGIKWELEHYHSDGLYIYECYKKCINRWIYINKTLCYYNKLND